MAKSITISKILVALLLALNFSLVCVCAMNLLNEVLLNFSTKKTSSVTPDSVFGNHEQYTSKTDFEGHQICTITDSPSGGTAVSKLLAEPKVDELRLDNCELDCEGYDSLGTLPFQSIMVSECNVSTKFLQNIAKVKTLRYLYFSQCFFEADGLKGLEPSHLFWLHLRECRKNTMSTCFDASDFATIASMSRLQRLDLNRMCFNNTALTALCNDRSKIRYIDCEHCYLDDVSMGILRGLPELEFIRLLGNQHLSPTAVQALASSKKVQHISSDIPKSRTRFIEEHKFQESLPKNLSAKFVD